MMGTQTSLIQRLFGMSALALATWTGPAVAQSAPSEPPKPWSALTSSELIAMAPKDAWAKLDQSHLLYLYFEPTMPGATNAHSIKKVFFNLSR